MKREGLFRLLFAFLLLAGGLAACREEGLTVELTREIKGYENALPLLFKLETRKINETLFQVRGEEGDLELFLKAVPLLPYIKDVRAADKSLLPAGEGLPQPAGKKIMLKYKAGTDDALRQSLETVFAFEARHLPNIDTYSYTLPYPANVPGIVKYLSSLPFVQYAEEDRPVKLFYGGWGPFLGCVLSAD